MVLTLTLTILCFKSQLSLFGLIYICRLWTYFWTLLLRGPPASMTSVWQPSPLWLGCSYADRFRCDGGSWLKAFKDDSSRYLCSAATGLYRRRHCATLCFVHSLSSPVDAPDCVQGNDTAKYGWSRGLGRTFFGNAPPVGTSFGQNCSWKWRRVSLNGLPLSQWLAGGCTWNLKES